MRRKASDQRFSDEVMTAVIAPRFHLSTPLSLPNLPDAIGGVSMNLRPQETQDLPSLCLKLIRLPGVVDALTDGRMKFQAVRVDQNSPGRDVREVGASIDGRANRRPRAASTVRAVPRRESP